MYIYIIYIYIYIYIYSYIYIYIYIIYAHIYVYISIYTYMYTPPWLTTEGSRTLISQWTIQSWATFIELYIYIGYFKRV